MMQWWRMLWILSLALTLAACPLDDQATDAALGDIFLQIPVDGSGASQDRDGGVDPGRDAAGRDIRSGVDASAPPDTGTPGLRGQCGAGTWSGSGFDLAFEFAAWDDAEHLEYVASSAWDDPYDLLHVQVYGAYGGPTAPGTFSLDGINFKDCGLCLLFERDCGAEDCVRTLYADQGSVEVSAIGGLGNHFSGVLHDVVLREVTIDPDTLVSTPVAGGQTWCLDSYAFDRVITTRERAMCDRPDITCIGETAPAFSLPNCGSGQNVSWSQMAQGHKAVWFVFVSGWCERCRAHLPVVLQTLEDRRDDGLEVVVVLGEDNRGEVPTVDYCGTFAGEFSAEPALFYLDPGFNTMEASLWVYSSTSGTYDLPYNMIVDAETGVYRYGDDGTNLTLEGVLEGLLD